MKKVLFKILSCALVLCVLFAGLTACSNASWEGTTMKSWGAVKSYGGFIAETDNYIYYVNGVATSTDDNTFGAPIKGTLMAADKSNLSKTEIVVPKLFAATDYNAGLFIDGDYVYYGTPSLDKAADGSIANSEMLFMKTKLDGTSSEELFKVDALSTEYRIAKNGSNVYIVYYDSTETALVSFDATSKTKTIIAKTDAEGEGMYSLADYTFVTGAEGNVSVLYTTTIYNEAYLDSKVEDAGYSRGTESYNNLFAYKMGDKVDEEIGLAGTRIGEATGYTYAVTYADVMVFYTETTTAATATVKTYGDTAANILANKKGVEIKNASYVADTNLINSLNEVYSYADGKLYKSTLIGNDNTEKQVVAITDAISKVLFVKDGSVYFVNTDNYIARLALNDADADVVLISEGTVSTSWYEPELVAIGGKTYLFYLDNSSLGASYVKYVDLATEVTAEDTDDDGEDDKFYLAGANFIGKMIDSDVASVFEAKVTAIASELDGGVLLYEEVDGALTVSSVTEVRAAYEALTKEVKELVSEDTLTTLANYEKAIEYANKYAKLDGMYGYNNKTDAEKSALKTAYQSIKESIEAFMESDDYDTISALISNNAKWNYQRAVELFEAE